MVLSHPNCHHTDCTLHCLLQVPEAVISMKACVEIVHGVSATLQQDGISEWVSISKQGDVHAAVQQWRIATPMPDPVWEQPTVRSSLFFAAANTVPRSFDNCIWDGVQHAIANARSGMMHDYEVIRYPEYIRRLAACHVANHWGMYGAFARIDHPQHSSSAAAYKQYMLQMWAPGGATLQGYPARYTELLAICDLFECTADVIDLGSGSVGVYRVYPLTSMAQPGKALMLLRQMVPCVDAAGTLSMGFYRVMVPADCTDIDLPRPGVTPPEVEAALHVVDPRHREIRHARGGVLDWVHEEVQSDDSCVSEYEGYYRIDSWPPFLCLAMPPRPLPSEQECRFHGKHTPRPWSPGSGVPDLNLFSFNTWAEEPYYDGTCAFCSGEQYLVVEEWSAIVVHFNDGTSAMAQFHRADHPFML